MKVPRVCLDRALRAWTRCFCRHMEDVINETAERQDQGPGDVLESLSCVASMLVEAKLRAAKERTAKHNQAFERRAKATELRAGVRR